MPSLFRVPVARPLRPAGIAFALGISLGIFLAIPLSQLLDAERPERQSVMRADLALPPPPPPPPDEPEPPPPEPEIEEPPPRETPPLSLDQLDLALNVGLGGNLAGDFGFGGFDLTQGLDNLDIFEIDQLDTPPRPIRQVAPIYPLEFARNRVRGQVRLVFVVDAEGLVENIQIETASHPEFGESAREAVRQWRFQPGERNQRPVRTRVRLPIPFNP